MKIGDVDIDERILIVAEVGNNHEGDFALAEKMVELAAEAGADAVKFQTFQTEHYVTRSDERRFAQLKKMELTFDQFESLAMRCEAAGVQFISTPFDLNSTDFLEPWVPAYKVASGDNTFYPLLDRISEKGKPIILSTGLADVEIIERALERIQDANDSGLLADRIVLLHCITSYPTPPEEVNLLAIPYLREKFGVRVGYSDHTMDTRACVAAVALGARIIEKHFTYRKEGQSFHDHALSADPKEFAKMVKDIRYAESLLGDRMKRPTSSEMSIHDAVRRSIATARSVSQGEALSLADLTWVRPGVGFKPGEEAIVIGRKAASDLPEGKILEESDLI